jgi:CDP-diacylglycerol--glycerol-3-phosphate 3-phosphatidyltransferase
LSPSLVSFLIVLGLLLTSMVVFALRGNKRDADAVSKNAQFLGGLGDFVLHWFLWVVDPAAKLSIKLGLTADFYNFAGLTLGAIAGLTIGFGQLELGGWALALSGVCDILDGRIARATSATSDYGAFVDSMLDRFIEFFAFAGFAVYLRNTPGGALIATAALGGSVLVSYSRAMGETLGVDCTGGLMQRGERLALLCLACLLDDALSRLVLHRPAGLVVTAALAFIGITGLVTAVQRTLWIAGRLRSRARETSKPPTV